MKRGLLLLILLCNCPAEAAPRNEVVIITGPHQDIAYRRGYQVSMDDYESQLRKHIELIELNPDIRYSMGNTYNTKYFIEKNPEYKNRLIKLMRDGKITTPALWVDFEPQWYSGEFLVRSVAYAKYWAMSTLQHTPHWAHLNDVPSLTPQFAQILAKSGVYILQVSPERIAWMIPDESYRWYVGLDGSKVVAHATGYDGMINFSDGDLKSLIPYIKKISEIKKLMLTAIHDMGTEAPRSKRLMGYIKKWNKDYADKYNCDVSMSTAEEYALYINKEIKEKNIKLPETTGIVSPWPHAGIHEDTLMPDITRMANMLPTVEMFSVAAEQLGILTYPHKKINSAWETILWTTDHNWGDETNSAKAEKLASGRKGYKITSELAQSVFSALAGAIKRPPGQGKLIVVFNPLNWKRSGMVEVTVPLKSGSRAEVVDSQGKKVPSQILSSKLQRDRTYKTKMLIQASDVPGLGYRSYLVKSTHGQAVSDTTLATGYDSIENKYYKVTADKQDQRISIYDKHNGMDFFDNEAKHPFGILDVTNWYNDLFSKMTIEKVKITRRGPLRATLEVTGTYTDGISVVQEFSLDRGQDRIQQSTNIITTSKVWQRYWNFFPWNKKIDTSMRLGIPYGSIPYYARADNRVPIDFSSRAPDEGFAILAGLKSRETDFFDSGAWSYDLQKWASFGDSSYTVDVAFENIQTRSYIKPGLMSTVLAGIVGHYRGPWNFSLRGHRGDWREANAPRFGWEVSHPLIGVAAKPDKTDKAVLPHQMSFWDVSSPGANVVISALKRGFDNKGVVLRFFEFLDRDTTVSVHPNPILHIPATEVSLTDMVEDPLSPIKKSGNIYKVPILGFGVETMKFFSRTVTDRVPPSPISDLRVVRGTSRTIKLAWTTTGDDNMEGRAASYDLRYYDHPINTKNWSKAIRLKNISKPAESGQEQQFRLEGLTPHKTHFLCIRSRDDAGNLSGLSNIVYFKTETRDRTPPGRINDLSVSASGATWVTLNWSASGDDGKKGTSDHYDVRFYTAAIDKTIWKKKATPVKIDLAPEKPGSPQSFIVLGLEPETKYYFAVAAVDEEGNASTSSNPVFRKTKHLNKIVYQNGVSPSKDYKGCSDTTISSVNKEEEEVNYGEAKFIRTWMGGTRQILVRFQKKGLPPNAKIHQARLKLYCYDLTYQDQGTATSYRIKKNWSENDATWHFATKSRKWPSPGKGIIDKTTDYRFGPNGIIDRAEVADGGGWVEFDITKALRNQTKDIDFGFAVKGNCPDDCGIYYYSSEYDDDPGKRPVLEISY